MKHASYDNITCDNRESIARCSRHTDTHTHKPLWTRNARRGRGMSQGTQRSSCAQRRRARGKEHTRCGRPQMWRRARRKEHKRFSCGQRRRREAGLGRRQRSGLHHVWSQPQQRRSVREAHIHQQLGQPPVHQGHNSFDTCNE